MDINPEENIDMFERIIEIIVHVISELRQNKQISEINVGELEQMGYTSSEISTAFSWLADTLDGADSFLSSVNYTKPESFRILHEAERDIFEKEAWGDLIQLHSLGILKNEHIENIIERTIMMGMRKIDSANLKSIVAMLVFNAEQGSQALRYSLNGNDLIN